MWGFAALAPIIPPEPIHGSYKCCLTVDKTDSSSSSPVPGFSGTARMETTPCSGTRPSPLSDSSEDDFDDGGYPPVDMESKLLNLTFCVPTPSPPV